MASTLPSLSLISYLYNNNANLLPLLFDVLVALKFKFNINLHYFLLCILFKIKHIYNKYTPEQENNHTMLLECTESCKI